MEFLQAIEAHSILIGTIVLLMLLFFYKRKEFLNLALKWAEKKLDLGPKKMPEDMKLALTTFTDSMNAMARSIESQTKIFSEYNKGILNILAELRRAAGTTLLSGDSTYELLEYVCDTITSEMESLLRDVICKNHVQDSVRRGQILDNLRIELTGSINTGARFLEKFNSPLGVLHAELLKGYELDKIIDKIENILLSESTTELKLSDFRAYMKRQYNKISTTLREASND